MDKIRDVLKVDVDEEIKQVIDVEDVKEREVQQEIGNYIVTDQLADDFLKLFEALDQKKEETGVWLSGFYGSGKSYFAKIFGYLLRNPDLGGTTAQKRFKRRLAGLDDKQFLINSLASTKNDEYTVVMMDLTKQGQGERGLAWILFENFLSQLGFMNTKYGLVEYDLYLNGDYEAFVDAVEEETGEPWSELKHSLGKSFSAMRQALESQFPDSYGNDVDQLYDDVDDEMSDFGADDLKKKLQQYLDRNPEHRIVFIVDEVSRSISDEKIDLGDLEGVQESLSAVGQSKVWLIAAAQEKLQDILNREGVSKNELSKISDRFKTKIHISGEEVDQVIEERLLKKNDDGTEDLETFYQENEGQISDLTNLQKCDLATTTTESKEEFSRYYPFHPYQLQLLKDFLFKVHQKVTGSQTPRGMIIVLDRVLKRLKDEPLHRMATAYQLGEEGDKFPSTAVQKRFKEASDHVPGDGDLNGRNLMQATHFLTETGKVTPTVEDITKSCLSQVGTYYDQKSDFLEAIDKLEDSSLLIKKDGYSIATETEERLMKEMDEEEVSQARRRQVLKQEIQETGLFSGFQNVELDGQTYPVKVEDQQGNPITGSQGANIKLHIASLYDIGSQDFQSAIEDLKYEHQGQEEGVLIVPRTDEFRTINNLIVKIRRYQVIENRYGNDSDQEIRRIARELQEDRRAKEQDLKHRLKKAYQNGVAIRDFEEFELSPQDFDQVVRNELEELADQLYTKRLEQHMEESRAEKVLTEENPERLSSYFEADQFNFFDDGGNFTGEGLRTVEEIEHRTADLEKDGKHLEEELTDPPYGWELGDVMVTLAVLLRAGQLKVEYEGQTILDWQDSTAVEVFSSARKFRKAQYQVVTVRLSSQQKRKLVDAIKEIDEETYADNDLGYNSADIHVVRQISQVAEGYLEETESLKRTLGTFSNEFPELDVIKDQLNVYTGRTINENTYSEVAEEFLSDYEEIKQRVQRLRELKSFQEDNLESLRQYRDFFDQLAHQTGKVEDQEQREEIEETVEQFHDANEKPVEKFPEIQGCFQQAKDLYHEAIRTEHEEMTDRYKQYREKLVDVRKQAEEAGEEVNRSLIQEINRKRNDTDGFTCPELSLGGSVKCEHCQNDLKTIRLALQNLSGVDEKLKKLERRIQSEDVDEDVGPETHVVHIRTDFSTVSELRRFLEDKLEQLRAFGPEDEIEIEVDIDTN